MKISRKTQRRIKQVAEAYIGWRSLKALGSLGTMAAVGYGAYRLYQHFRAPESA